MKTNDSLLRFTSTSYSLKINQYCKAAAHLSRTNSHVSLILHITAAW